MSSIIDLSRESPVLSPSDSVAHAAETFLHESCAPFLSIPVIDGSKPVGILTRHRLQQIYLSRYGRDLHARKRIGEVMETRPIVIEAAMPLEDAARHISDRVGFPIREDFIVVQEGCFHGVGVVVDLLKAMERQMAARSRELSEALQRLHESQAQLVQSEKMASLGQMVAGVAHEMNTPLGYLRSNLEIIGQFTGTLRELAESNLLLLERLEDPASDADAIESAMAKTRAAVAGNDPSMLLDELGQLLDDTLHGCDQISELVGSLKDFSRLDRAASEDVDLNACVNSALLIARNVTKDRAEVIRDLGLLPPIRCIPSQVNQVLLNLVTNAAQAIERQGKILVRTRLDGAHVVIVVQDNGRGIARENLSRIFDPFFTTKPVGQGTGLGLAICYRIVEQHGGDIRVESEPGKGTRFTVRLPFAPQPEIQHLNA